MSTWWKCVFRLQHVLWCSFNVPEIYFFFLEKCNVFQTRTLEGAHFGLYTLCRWSHFQQQRQQRKMCVNFTAKICLQCVIVIGNASTHNEQIHTFQFKTETQVLTQLWEVFKCDDFSHQKTHKYSTINKLDEKNEIKIIHRMNNWIHKIDKCVSIRNVCEYEWELYFNKIL